MAGVACLRGATRFISYMHCIVLLHVGISVDVTDRHVHNMWADKILRDVTKAPWGVI